MGTLLNLPLFPLLMAVLFTVQSKTHWEDIELLKQLKNGLNRGSIPPGSCIGSWDFAFDPCDSLFSRRFTCGFRCDLIIAGTSRLTELALDQAGYSGSLSPLSLSWNLPYLETLDFSNNFFSGPIPDSFSNLTRLSRLSLTGNSFSDEIPAGLGSLVKLEEMYLNGNNFTGEVPASFGNLVGLKRLELQSNRFTGTVPKMGTLKNLNYLDISDNGFSGEIPASLPESLLELSMRNNSLNGTIPSIFKNLINLQVMDLSHNRFTESVPASLFHHPSLQQLSLSFNNLTGIESPPSNLVNQSELIAVDLSNNEIEGFLPAFMAAMPKLSALSMENNRFSGMIPIGYAMKAAAPEEGEAALERLWLAGNYLFGPIPDALRKLSRDSVNVRLADNCLVRCPVMFYFCQGGEQKSLAQCRIAGSVIP